MFFNKQRLPIVYFSLTDACNSKCKTCSYWQNTKVHLDLALFEAAVDNLYGYKIDNLIFTGGEPLLNKRIFEFALIARNKLKPKKLSLMTNGILIQNNLEMICKSFDRVVLSIDSVNEKTYKQIRGVNKLTQVMKSIPLLKSHSEIEVKVKCTIQKLNFTQFSDIVKTVKDYGADSISFISIDTSNEIAFSREGINYQDITKYSKNKYELLNLKENLSQYIISNKELFESGFILESPQTLMNILVERPLQLLNSNALKSECNALESTVIIESNGEIRNCFFTNKIGNILTNNLSESLSGQDYLNQLHQFKENTLKPCEKCICPYTVTSSDANDANMPQR